MAQNPLHTPQETERCADNVRALALSMVEQAKSGHPGGAMGGADFLNVLFLEYLRYDPQNLQNPSRDRFFLDPGHMSPMFYAQLALSGILTIEELKAFRSLGSPTTGHPERDPERMIENGSGPLGQGHSYAVGAAIAGKYLQNRLGAVYIPGHIYAYVSDGGIQEEIAAGAARIAGHLGLDNLTLFYDANDIQISGSVSEVSVENMAAKYTAWGWHVIEINGNDAAQIREALDQALAHKGEPTLIIGHTVMAYKCVDAQGRPLADTASTHGQPLSKAGADLSLTLQGLGADPQNPFVIYPDVADLYARRREELNLLFRRLDKEQEAFAATHPQIADKFRRWFAGEQPDINWAAIEQKSGAATRSAGGVVLAHLAQETENLIVSSADLATSDKTSSFLKYTQPLRKGDFSGRFLHAGVSELTMAAVCVGITLHGGMRAACATFFAFSDYMKPVVRMAALMELPVIFIWSHDSFRVGEDGPTHQPVEQEAQIRLLEALHNHSGRRALQVFRPADVHETTTAWQMAWQEQHRPTALILSRQDIPDLPTPNGTPYERALGLQKGAYVVSDNENPALVLLASGSEVGTLEEAAQTLRREGKRVRVVSVPSEGLFRDQSPEYQESVLPAGVPRYGLTAGLPLTLLGLVGNPEHIHGLDHFGYSAPAKVLDREFGFTPEAVVADLRAKGLI